MLRAESDIRALRNHQVVVVDPEVGQGTKSGIYLVEAYAPVGYRAMCSCNIFRRDERQR
jgi:hypothetical protein